VIAALRPAGPPCGQRRPPPVQSAVGCGPHAVANRTPLATARTVHTRWPACVATLETISFPFAATARGVTGGGVPLGAGVALTTFSHPAALLALNPLPPPFPPLHQGAELFSVVPLATVGPQSMWPDFCVRVRVRLRGACTQSLWRSSA
jgi:hypothetical protein